MKQKLANLAPKGVTVTFPRKDVVHLLIQCQKLDSFLLIVVLLAGVVLIGITLLFADFGGLLTKTILLLLLLTVAFYYLRRRGVMMNGQAEIILTPREIQQELLWRTKIWQETNKVRWRNVQVFSPEVTTANEISTTGATTPRGQLDKHLDWGQREMMKEWMKRAYHSFYTYYNKEQIHYLEQWMEVQYQYYKNNPQVDELEEDHFLSTTNAVEIDLSEHLIES